MGDVSYKLTEPVSDFHAGDILVVTARFGDWHIHDVKLETPVKSDTRSVELTESEFRTVTERVE